MSNYIATGVARSDEVEGPGPQEVECRRCRGLGEDSQGADCVHCDGMGSTYLR